MFIVSARWFAMPRTRSQKEAHGLTVATKKLIREYLLAKQSFRIEQLLQANGAHFFKIVLFKAVCSGLGVCLVVTA